MKPCRGRVLDPHRRDAGGRVQRVGGDAERLDDVVLEQAVDEDDVGPEQLLAAGDLLADDSPVMGDDLEVEVGDPDAGVALAARRRGDVPEAALEREVGALDGVLEGRARRRLGVST